MILSKLPAWSCKRYESKLFLVALAGGPTLKKAKLVLGAIQ